MSKIFKEEAEILSAVEMSSARGGIQEKKVCACVCVDSEIMADTNAGENHVAENSFQIAMP